VDTADGPDVETPDPLAATRTERARLGRELVEGVVVALPGWVERCVERHTPPAAGSGVVAAALIVTAADQAQDEGRAQLSAAVAREPGVDAGPAPLQVLRSLVRHPTTVLLALGVPAIARDPFERDAFPDDVYGLSPATWADIDPALQDPGLAWGAATAYLHKQIRAQG
jgi:hypothetical protein